MGFAGLHLSWLSANNRILAMSTTLNLVSEMERIASALGTEAEGAAGVSLSAVAEKIAKNLGVKHDEVAILAVSTRWRHLHFLVPEALKNVGFVPLSSNSALAARTARESRPEIENNFAATRHATVFESVKVADAAGAIQKMISAPILLEGKVIGVIQVSRKGANPHCAGPDFTSQDLGNILALCKPLGKMLRHVAGE
ncbi:MAG TPA: GAF domain-containing protein [Candidatus Polarisedimenticolia bacterium]|nr:GAF domain-containing protein [Candidatus Polarisedimenticolia bacterium]